jgi:serine/threonine-protein kinase
MLEPGELIDGKYRVRRLLGKGGMGAVFEGFHTLVERRVAIKVLHADVAASPDGAARFAREVRAAGRIGNDHILEIYDVGSLPDGARYMVSEFLDGETLSSRLNREGRLSPSIAAGFALQLLTGLAAAHQAGIVHRDLKPDNIFLLREKSGRRDFVKIIDFGISKFQADDGTPLLMTATGAVLGTPYYLSPEQARGLRDIDGRSDLYAVGVILYQAVAGRLPIQAESFNELLFKIALETPPSLAEIVRGIDPNFSALTQKAMARERAERFQSAEELRAALVAWLDEPASLAVPAVSALPQIAPPAARVSDVAAETQVPAFAAEAQVPALAAETRASAPAVETQGSPVETAPTSSNFGRTAEHATPAAAAANVSRARTPLIVGSLLAISAASAALVWSRKPVPAGASLAVGDVSAVSAKAPSGVASALPAAPILAPSAAIDVPPLALSASASSVSSVSSVSSSSRSTASAPAKPAPTITRPIKKSAAGQPLAQKAAAKQAATEPPRSSTSTGTAKSKAGRDFGY